MKMKITKWYIIILSLALSMFGMVRSVPESNLLLILLGGAGIYAFYRVIFGGIHALFLSKLLWTNAIITGIGIYSWFMMLIDYTVPLKTIWIYVLIAFLFAVLATALSSAIYIKDTDEILEEVF